MKGSLTVTPAEGAKVSRGEPPTVATRDLEQHAHLIYRCLRPHTPFIKRDDGVYIAIRAAEVERLATDPRTRQMETEMAWSRGVTKGPLFEFFKNTMLFSNGAEHQRRRSPLTGAFAFDLIDALRPRIRAIADELIDRTYARGEMNLIYDYAAWLPARVISEVLGLPAAEIPVFTRHAYTLSRALSSSFSRDDVPELEAAAEKMMRYADELLQSRHSEPRDDFLTAYIVELAESGTLSPIEATMQIVAVILAGSDTTRSAIAIQTSLLLQHREQWNALCEDRRLISGAVTECLRYEPSVASFPRFTLGDIEIDGWKVPRHRVLSLSTLSAMRDPALYANPDRFDIARADHPRRHMAFGTGSHRCLGAMLARVELEEALAALADRIPQMQLVGDAALVRGSGGIRTVDELQVRWDKSKNSLAEHAEQKRK
ncbi:MAG: cytochrome P450 [Steroidobacteraceae bacterium]